MLTHTRTRKELRQYDHVTSVAVSALVPKAVLAASNGQGSGVKVRGRGPGRRRLEIIKYSRPTSRLIFQFWTVHAYFQPTFAESALVSLIFISGLFFFSVEFLTLPLADIAMVHISVFGLLSATCATFVAAQYKEFDQEASLRDSECDVCPYQHFPTAHQELTLFPERLLLLQLPWRLLHRRRRVHVQPAAVPRTLLLLYGRKVPPPRCSRYVPDARIPCQITNTSQNPSSDSGPAARPTAFPSTIRRISTSKVSADLNFRQPRQP